MGVYRVGAFDGETGEIIEIAPDKLVLRMEDADAERLVEYPGDDWWSCDPAVRCKDPRTMAAVAHSLVGCWFKCGSRPAGVTELSSSPAATERHCSQGR